MILFQVDHVQLIPGLWFRAARDLTDLVQLVLFILSSFAEVITTKRTHVCNERIVISG